MPKPSLSWTATLLASAFSLVETGAAGGATKDTAQPGSFVSLCYHDVRDEVLDDLDPDRFAVGTDALVAQLEWMQAHGYRPVSLQAIEDARSGGAPLPDKAVLLTFDDGFRSVYTRVFPLLKLYGAPAVVSLVGRWLDAGPDELVGYGNATRPRGDFLAWDEIREMVDSGLVEVASHSYDLHHGVRGNPQGNLQPAAVTRRYDPETGSYESRQAHRERLRRDLEANSRLIEENLGVRPRAVVWPYGAFSRESQSIASELGMRLSLGLRAGSNELSRSPASTTVTWKRQLLEENPGLSTFVAMLRNDGETVSPLRIAHVDLDYIYDSDEGQQERNLSRLLDRVRELQITTVYLQAFADADADGTASALYFPNRHLPVKADLFNRVAWQLRTRSEVTVYAWLPLLAFDLPDPALSRELRVEELVEIDDRKETRPTEHFYRRLSPYKPRARRVISEIYEDLGAFAHFGGLLFHDDGYLAANEDAAALALPGADGLPSPREKSELLIAFTDELTERVERYRPGLETARNLYASILLEPESEGWFAQNFALALESYDHPALMAMPYMEGAEDPFAWLEKLVARVAEHPAGLERTVFELQAVVWREDRPLPSKDLAAQLEWLQRLGALHLGYYPDDFLEDSPELEIIRPAISVATYPHRRH